MARAARVALRPAAALYAAVVDVRNALYDAAVLPTRATVIPAVSIGNLTAGGTGKTPVAAWMAGRLAAAGAHPGIVLRGYGADEPAVHRVLQPGIPVVTNPDRVAGVRAAADAGADVVVLDDAFQHRRVARVVDLVLVSADHAEAAALQLPAGPYRETVGALARAHVALVTRKAATADAALARAVSVRAEHPALRVAVVHLAPTHLVEVSTATQVPLSWLRGRPVVVACGIGDPAAFAAQLRGAGAAIRLHAFRDHHRFTESDVTRLLAEAGRAGSAKHVVCTLKDAVKLAPLWPGRGAGLWYLAQSVIVEAGHDELDWVIDTVLAARSSLASATS